MAEIVPVLGCQSSAHMLTRHRVLPLAEEPLS